MVEKTKDGLEFDPGFGSHILALRGTVEYLYTDINKFKNLSQRKMKFLMYYKKILSVLNNNLGFYVGCLMWASYLCAQPKQEILSNDCYGQKYNHEENILETQYILQFFELFPKDMKYFLSQDFTFDENLVWLVKTYEEFLELNKGFVETKYNSDIVLPEKLEASNVKNYKKYIDDVTKTGKLEELLQYLPEIMK